MIRSERVSAEKKKNRPELCGFQADVQIKRLSSDITRGRWQRGSNGWLHFFTVLPLLKE